MNARAAALLALLPAGCTNDPPPKPVTQLTRQAEAAAQEVAAQTLEPHEINNIKRRRLLMGKPGLISYVVFINDAGQPIDYFVADGKCTSSGKRLLRPQELVLGDVGTANGHFVMDAPSADGTFGTSQPYIYCFTTDGAYKEWSGDYYISDRPVELSIAPLVVRVDAPAGVAP